MVSYVHRVGRTGRAFRVGSAITFYTKSDKFMLRKLADMIKNSGCDVPDWIFKLKKQKREYYKKLARIPMKRDDLSGKKGKDDEKFRKYVKRRDHLFYRKQNQNSKKESMEEEGGWQVAGEGGTDFPVIEVGKLN